MKEALNSSEISVLTRTTRRNVPEGNSLHSHHRGNFKSYTRYNTFLTPIHRCRIGLNWLHHLSFALHPVRHFIANFRHQRDGIALRRSTVHLAKGSYVTHFTDFISRIEQTCAHEATSHGMNSVISWLATRREAKFKCYLQEFFVAHNVFFKSLTHFMDRRSPRNVSVPVFRIHGSAGDRGTESVSYTDR
jgi:hypothetical protein